MNTQTKTKENFFVERAVSLFNFFASLRLAVTLLVTLMGVLAAGTFIESLHGTESAALSVYQAPWFAALLTLLGINVAAAALDRLPWKKKHTGFVLTHLGIILILIGSFISQHFTLDGHIAIAEGDTEHRIALNKPILYVFSQESGKDWIFRMTKKPFEWKGEEGLKAVKDFPAQIHMLEYFPKARLRESLREAVQGPPAIEGVIASDFMSQDFSLIYGSPSQSKIDLGPLVIHFAAEPFSPGAKEPEKASSYLEFRFEDGVRFVPIPQPLTLPYETDIEGKSIKVKIVQVFKNAAVEGRDLVESKQTSSTANPAVQFTLIGEGFEENHTAFARYPEFPTVHGMDPSRAGAAVIYRIADSGSRGEHHEIRFIPKGGALQYQVIEGIKVKGGVAAVGETIDTGWMNFTFKVNRFLPSAEKHRTFTPLLNTAEGDNVMPAAKLRFTGRSGASEIWLGQGVKEQVVLDGKNYTALFGQETIPAGFKLTLKDFRMEQYPGTERPASFKSEVVLKDSFRGVVKEATISMNEPLEYRGIHIYQSGYQLAEGQPEVSVFSVGRDTGIPWKYVGTVVMVSGILIMFYTKKFSSHSGKVS